MPVDLSVQAVETLFFQQFKSLSLTSLGVIGSVSGGDQALYYDILEDLGIDVVVPIQ